MNSSASWALRAEAFVYTGGPEPLILAVERHCTTWPEGSLHVERFAPEGCRRPVVSGDFQFELARTGQVLTVPPAKSVLDVLEGAGVSIDWSCQDGTCGTCETPVLEGDVDHRDSLLTPAEQAANDKMYVCVSRAACPKLVLDL